MVPVKEEVTLAVRAAVQAAAWAPSVHNTQPWSFAISDNRIDVRADTDRTLRVEDPQGREMLISCGAALLNVRLALRALGYEPQVRILPDPERPALLATVVMGPGTNGDEYSKMLYGEIERRRTHRGGFTDQLLPRNFIDALAAEARKEGARFTPVIDESAEQIIAAITRAAQGVQSRNTAYSLEVLRWARSPYSTRGDVVPADAYPKGGGRRDFPQRDYAQGRMWGYEPIRQATSPGLVAVLTTKGDTREEWIAAGQALQRVLLFASAYGVRAAFHTQPLEMYHLREFLRQELFSGEYPQMIMRLGITQEEGSTRRRPLEEIIVPL